MSALAPNLLSSLEESFLHFVESVPDAMVLSDPDGRIVLVNTNAQNLFGYSREELVGKQVEVLLPGRFRARHRRHRSDYYVNSAIRPMGIGQELLACRKDGSEFSVEINLSPVQIQERRYVWSAIRDVSRQVHITSERPGVHRALISVCAWCKRAHDEVGSWQPLEDYVASHSQMRFTHGLCPDCLRKLDPSIR